MNQEASDSRNVERPDLRTNRRYAVSANRGNASQKVRYVEAGGAAVDTGECTFCQSFPELGDKADK
ncbi:hypothetical protein [Marinobacter arenosus]|uniref:hypothetical protein n=1 Tax=Marinobacter arenosus TaxID=2856822 RepID=UPI001C4DB8ED|nr:hypothetical protein [Marinobacter arenosus]MBW0146315.1 hypothetical protein [Marinobacter arenosus]